MIHVPRKTSKPMKHSTHDPQPSTGILLGIGKLLLILTGMPAIINPGIGSRTFTKNLVAGSRSTRRDQPEDILDSGRRTHL